MMKSLKVPLIAIALLAFFAFGNVFADTPQLSTNKPLSVAIFSRNKTRDANNDKYVDMFQSGLTTEFSDKFAVINKDDVLNIFQRESRKEEKNGFKMTDLFPFLDVITKITGEVTKQDSVPAEQKASSLKIAQAMKANYFVIADVEEIVSNNIKDTVYGNQINDVSITADLSVKILDGVKGGTVAADSVRVEKRLHGDEKSNFTKEDVAQAIPVLMKQAAKDVFKKFVGSVEKERGVKIDAEQVQFGIKTNVPVVAVELDGQVIGTAPGTFKAMTGPHRMRATKQGYRTFERDVNVFNNAEFSVSLEESGDSQVTKSKQGKTDSNW
ncbi:MAG: PEGA domain-containing protein [Candidatus Omnitrophota bacterium]